MLIDLIGSELILAEVYSLFDAAHRVSDILKDQNINLKSELGKTILDIFSNKAKQDHYGELNRYFYCHNCEISIEIGISSDSINKILTNKLICDSCGHKLKRRYKDEGVLEEILSKLDPHEYHKRIYPAHIYALQLHKKISYEKKIDSNIIQPLIELTNYEGIKFNYRFIENTVNPFQLTKRTIPGSWVEQFIRDLIVYGLHEAIAYFHSYEFTNNPKKLISSSVSIYGEIARAFKNNEKGLKNSKNKKIQSLLKIIKIYTG